MIIHPPEINEDGAWTRLSARVVAESSRLELPDQLWFAFSREVRPHLSERAEGFAAACLPLAMALGEPIEIRGPLSPRLAFGIREYQRVLHAWYPQLLHLVEVSPSAYAVAPGSGTGGNVGTAFSGGVDSFFTLWQHLPANEPIPGFRLAHALFVHGFDIPLADEATFPEACASYGPMLDRAGIRLVPAKTNARAFVQSISWDIAHGAALIGTALCLGQLFRRFYVPASMTPTITMYWGSDYRLDHHLSTEATEILHDGAGFTRVEKTETIARWPETYDRLRVCWARPRALANCCRCPKCIRTMLTLDLAGALPKYSTFPAPLDRGQVRRTRIRALDRHHIQWVLDRAQELGRRDVVADLRRARARSRLLDLLGR